MYAEICKAIQYQEIVLMLALYKTFYKQSPKILKSILTTKAKEKWAKAFMGKMQEALDGDFLNVANKPEEDLPKNTFFIELSTLIFQKTAKSIMYDLTVPHFVLNSLLILHKILNSLEGKS